MPKLFTKKVFVDRPEKKDTIKNRKLLNKYFYAFLISLILLAILGYAVFRAGLFVNSVSTRWEEIRFAYEKPSIVKVIRQDYQSQQKKVDQSFLVPQKSSEQQLVDDVVKKLQAKNLE